MSEDRESEKQSDRGDRTSSSELRRQAQSALKDLHLVEMRVKRIVDLYEERLRNEPPRQ